MKNIENEKDYIRNELWKLSSSIIGLAALIEQIDYQYELDQSEYNGIANCLRLFSERLNHLEDLIN